MTEQHKRLTHDGVQRRIGEGVKAVIEEVLERRWQDRSRSMQFQAKRRERVASRRGERNGHYSRNLVTPSGRIEQLRVPRAREGPFLTEVFERYRRMTGSMEEAVLEMYLQGVSAP